MKPFARSIVKSLKAKLFHVNLPNGSEPVIVQLPTSNLWSMYTAKHSMSYLWTWTGYDHHKRMVSIANLVSYHMQTFSIVISYTLVVCTTFLFFVNIQCHDWTYTVHSSYMRSILMKIVKLKHWLGHLPQRCERLVVDKTFCVSSGPDIFLSHWINAEYSAKHMTSHKIMCALINYSDQIWMSD